MDYRSARRMCGLARGFVEGAAAHYGETVGFSHMHCAERGEAHCTFKMQLADKIS
jgi:predicted hydrocarbon binding protein